MTHLVFSDQKRHLEEKFNANFVKKGLKEKAITAAIFLKSLFNFNLKYNAIKIYKNNTCYYRCYFYAYFKLNRKDKKREIRNKNAIKM